MNDAASHQHRQKLTASSCIEIGAPIETVWSAMTDLHHYHEWNPFIVGFDEAPNHPTVGTRMRLHVVWANGKRVRSWETLTRLDPPTPVNGSVQGGRIATMAYEFSSWIARTGLVVATREQIIHQVPGGPTIYQTEEVFRGVLGRFVPLANVEDGFRRHALALKQRAERMIDTGAGDLSYTKPRSVSINQNKELGMPSK